MKKFFALFGIIFIVSACSAFAQEQFKQAMVGVSGLTCSACCKTVEMSIRKLSFVKNVQMNLENTEGKILFKDNADIDIEKVAEAVIDAGFSVRYLTADLVFNQITVTNGYCFSNGKYNLQFVNIPEKKLEGQTTLRFIGPKFQPKNEYSRMKSVLRNSCAGKNQKVYFVSL